jgi:enoyl-CoA hydratase/carnithine racemase
MALVLTEVRDRVAIVTLNDPDRRNSLTGPMVDEIVDTFDRLETDDAVGAVVITGAGPGFCAGADLGNLGGQDGPGFRSIYEGFMRVGRSTLPTLAAVNGAAVGAGMNLALACDLRVAAETASVGLPEVALGIIPGGGGTQRLPRLVGVARAKDLVLTARRVPAAEALAMGLVSQIVPAGRLLEVAAALAETIARNAPVSLRQAKRAIDGGFHLPLEEALALETRMYQECLGTKDRLEALRAFAEKRPPVFTGE